ncbi:MAG: response regulator, partial [Rhodocyclaceae bacterium]
ARLVGLKLTDADESILIMVNHALFATRSPAERLRQILDTASCLIVELDAEGRITEINRHACEMIGLPPEALQGRSLFGEFVAPPPSGSPGKPIYRQLVAGTWGGETTFEASLQGNRGDHLIDWKISGLKDGSGTLAIGQDVTERRPMAEALRAAQTIPDADWRAQVTQAAAIGLWEWSVGGIHYIWDETMYALHGLAPGKPAITMEDWLDLLLQDDREQTAQEIGQALDRGQGVASEFRIVQPDGKVRWLRLIGIVRRREGTHVTAMSGVAWDISGLKETQHKLEQLNKHLEARVSERTSDVESARQTALSMARDAESARRQAEESLLRLRVLSSAVEQSPIAMFITDGEGHIQYVNPKFEELTAFSSADALGKKPSLLSSGRMPHRFFEELWGQIRRGHEWQGDICDRRKSGEFFWSHTLISPVRHDDGRVSQFIGIMEDVTEKRAATDMLLRAKEAADEANQAKSEFLANMSHEIRTPMNAIIGMAYLALRTELSAKQRDYVEKIHLSGQHLLGIVEDVLDFSKIEAGKLEIENIDFELDTVLDGLANLLGSKAAAKQLELLFDIDPALTRRLNGDPLRLGQILINYTNNAIKFTERGTVIVRIERIAETADAVDIRCSVEDTGIGMSEAQKNLVFQSFQQADSSTTRRFGGTGLGLAISKRLVELMGGAVGVNTELGKGSTFWFSLHLGQGLPLDRRTLPDELHGKPLLAVVDHDAARRIVARQLREMGFRVDCAGSGEQAIGMLREQDKRHAPYEIVFLDLKGRETDALETARRLKMQGLKHPPPRILLGCYSHDPAIYEAEDSGINDFVLKPMTARTLLTAILRTVREPGAALPSQASQSTERLQGTQLLLVEDSLFNQQLAFEILENSGARVRIASNGEEAICQLAGETFDAVLMDVQMPVMDGLEATRRIRLMPKYAALPIIAMTANAFAQDRERCRAAGMNDYITKPINPEQLVSRLERWLRARPADSADSLPTVTEPAANRAAGHADAAALDLSQLAELVHNDPQRIRKFAQRFLQVAYDTHREMENALNAGDYDALRALGHRLKASASTVGAAGFADLCTRIEHLADDTRAAPLLADLSDALPRLACRISEQTNHLPEQEKKP